jgi:hypothetical protein
MPNRYLRDGILDSDRVNSLSFEAEVFYRRLMSAVDDFGRFDGRISILKGRLYALKPSLREADIPRWIAECEKAGLIASYQVGGKPYLLFHRLGEARARTSKFPAPPAGISETLVSDVGGREHMHADANICSQTQTDAPSSSSPSPSSSITTSITTVADSTKKRKGKAKPDDDLPWTHEICPLPNDHPDFARAWGEWIASRKSQNDPVTNRMAKLQIEKIRRAGLTIAEAADCVFESAANGWKGLFPEKILSKRNGSHRPPSMQPTGNGIVPSIYRTAEPGKTLHDEITPEMLRIAMYNDPFHKKPAAS